MGIAVEQAIGLSPGGRFEARYLDGTERRDGAGRACAPPGVRCRQRSGAPEVRGERGAQLVGRAMEDQSLLEALVNQTDLTGTKGSKEWIRLEESHADIVWTEVEGKKHMPWDQEASVLWLIAVERCGPDVQDEVLSQPAESCLEPAGLSAARVLDQVRVLDGA
jgi:hypothetical protein